MFNGAWPAGWIDAAHVPLLLARAAWLAALLSAAGALSFAAGAAGREPIVRNGLRRIARNSLLAAYPAWAVWVSLQAAAIAGATDPAAAFAALGPVISRTQFGHVALAQVALLLLAGATLRLGRGAPALLALAAVGLQVMHLHAFAMNGWASLLTVAVVLHLGAAALWLGGLLPLRLVVRAAPLAVAQAVVRRFSRRATLLVAILAASALYQGFALVGGVPGLFGATYGWAAMAKIVLFAVLLALAGRNRFRLTPALAGSNPAQARAALSRSIAWETGVGLAILLAASVLTALPPGMHGQPVWPFVLRPRLPLPAADIFLVAAATVSVLLLAAALLTRRRRVLGLLVAVALLAVTGWRLGQDSEAATPTGFYRSQTGFTAASVADGGTLFAAHCAACHAGGTLRLAAADGDLFWVLSAAGPNMPGFAATLDEDQRWHLVDFLRARAAAGRRPSRAPDLDLACADGSAPSLSDLRGRLVRIVFLSGDTGPRPLPDDADVVTLPVPADPEKIAAGCVVADADAASAYAVATGLAEHALAGSELLIDRDGRLRDIVLPGTDAVSRAAAFGRLAAPAGSS